MGDDGWVGDLQLDALILGQLRHEIWSGIHVDHPTEVFGRKSLERPDWRSGQLNHGRGRQAALNEKVEGCWRHLQEHVHRDLSKLVSQHGDTMRCEPGYRDGRMRRQVVGSAERIVDVTDAASRPNDLEEFRETIERFGRQTVDGDHKHNPIWRQHLDQEPVRIAERRDELLEAGGPKPAAATEDSPKIEGGKRRDRQDRTVRVSIAAAQSTA